MHTITAECAVGLVKCRSLYLFGTKGIVAVATCRPEKILLHHNTLLCATQLGHQMRCPNVGTHPLDLMTQA